MKEREDEVRKVKYRTAPDHRVATPPDEPAALGPAPGVAPTDERSALATMMRQSARPPHGTAPKCTTRRVMERRKEHPVPAPTATPRSRVTTARVTHDTSESSAPEPPDAPKEASQCLTDTSTTTRAPDERNVKRSSDIPA